MNIPTFKFALRDDIKDDKRFLPSRTTSVSTGWDVRCAQEDRKPIVLRPGQYVKIPLGFRTIAADGWWLKLEPRSSTFVKKSLHCLCGVIDQDYRGYMFQVGQYLSDVSALGKDLILEFGEPIGQLIPYRLEDMNIEQIGNEEFDAICKENQSMRDHSGFGATRGLK